MPEPRLTLAEKAAVVRLELRGLRRAAAGLDSSPDLDRKVAAIYDQARKREQRGK